ncbi:hypothetical protein B0H13DRAFT_1897152 [Mycena leptocephala]|nr:hypothetical protein B0H13DRAFT_1897152 [Mycena leptocephala]
MLRVGPPAFVVRAYRSSLKRDFQPTRVPGLNRSNKATSSGAPQRADLVRKAECRQEHRLCSESIVSLFSQQIIPGSYRKKRPSSSAQTKVRVEDLAPVGLSRSNKATSSGTPQRADLIEFETGVSTKSSPRIKQISQGDLVWRTTTRRLGPQGRTSSGAQAMLRVGPPAFRREFRIVALRSGLPLARQLAYVASAFHWLCANTTSIRPSHYPESQRQTRFYHKLPRTSRGFVLDGAGLVSSSMGKALIALRSTPRVLKFSRPKILRPMRAVRLTRCDPLDRWLATVGLKSPPDQSLHDPLPSDEVLCALVMSPVEGILGPVYGLALVAYDPRTGRSPHMLLGRFAGSPGDPDAPLWVRRLPLRKLMWVSQPRAFVARLVGGMTDIPVKSVHRSQSISSEMLSWARDTAVRHSKTS